MSRAGWMAFAASFLLVPAQTPAQTPTQLPSPTAVSDSTRADLIERVARSIIHVRGVRPAEPGFDPYTGLTTKERERRIKQNPLLSQVLMGKPQPIRTEGSAFIFDSARGLAITASHIVAGSTSLSAVLPDGQERPLEIVGIDAGTGIAVLRVEGMTLPALPFAAKRPRAGETALIVGRMIPFNATMASQGMVMGDANFEWGGSSGLPVLSDFFALDNLLPNGGMGGGPAVNMKGEVIGLVSAIYGARGYGQESLTLALRVGELQSTVTALIANGKIRRGMLGLATNCVDRVCTLAFVLSGGPAAAAGLKAGDQLLTLDGAPVTSELILQRRIAAAPVGTAFTLSVKSADAVKSVTVTSIAKDDTPDIAADLNGYTPPPPD
jgi:S1-C subfamily serine protease